MSVPLDWIAFARRSPTAAPRSVAGPMALVLAAGALLLGGVAGAAPIRAAYFYDYMPPSHIGSLAAAGFDRVLVKFSDDSLHSQALARVRAMGALAHQRGVRFIPAFNLQSRSRLAASGTSRRYTWGDGDRVEYELACPLDSAYWHSVLIERAREFLALSPDVGGLVLDLEVYFGDAHHYDRGPCRCPGCLSEYNAEPVGAALSAGEIYGLHAFEEVRLTRVLTAMLRAFALLHPGVEIGVFDLDLDSFVHRALARALALSGVPTVDYCEATYATGAVALAEVRERLTAVGLGDISIIGGFWLKKWTPDRLEPAIAEMNRSADGYFVFTTFSLWSDPRRLAGPYTVAGAQGDYWAALRRANQWLTEHSKRRRVW